MIKILIALILFSTPVFAQFELNETPAKVDSKNKEKNITTKNITTKNNEDDGLFSFMSKGFFNKSKIQEKTADDRPFLEKLESKANNNDAKALSALGYIYLYGEESLNIKPDYNKSVIYYTKAAQLNDATALNNLANIYYTGLGVDVNKEKAASLFKKAADLGDNEACVNLAFMYLSGNGVTKNKSEAIALFAKASKKDNALANYMLGVAYYYGVVLPVDYDKSFNFVKKAADADYDEAQVFLARLYMNGIGTPQNYGIAVNLLNKAFGQGNVEATFELANVYASGQKYPQDFLKAHILYNLASVKGVSQASERRAATEKMLSIEEILEAQNSANNFVESPSDITKHTRQTFGEDISSLMIK